MKICILIERLNSGGAERSAGLVSTMLADLGYDLVLITLFDDVAYPFSGDLINLGKYKKGSRNIFNKYLRYRELNRILKINHFDLILDFRMKNFPLREWLLNKFVFKTKMVNMVRSFKLDWYLPNPKLLSKYLYKNYSGINTVSLDITNEIKKNYNLLNVKTIYNAIDIKFLDKKAQKSIIVNEEFIIALGSFKPVKQIDKLVNAYNKSMLPEQNINLLLIGQGPEQERIEEKIRELHLTEKVKIIPFQENPFKYLSKAKFLVSSSFNEGFPRVLIESLACGTPVISFNCKSGPSEIIQHEKNGLLVEDQNFEQLINAMNSFISNSSLYNACKIHSKNSIQDFTTEKIRVEWKKYIEEIFIKEK